MTFIEKLTEYIISKYGNNLKELCIVLPNRRAGLYLKKNIPVKLKKITWAPYVFSIEDFVCHITGIGVADPMLLLTELYKAYASIEGSKAQSFDEFMNWAPVLISDYNDCDINLADTITIFKLLNEAKAISQWNLEKQALTDYEKDYLNFYNSLSKYYPEFVFRLLNKNVAFQGLIYKKAADNIDHYATLCNFRKIIFAGFNALTQSEEKIIKSLLTSGKAEIIWDSDKYYSENNIHEAGMFIRKYRHEWKIKDFHWDVDHYKTLQKNISLTGVPLSIGQAEYAGQLLSRMKAEDVNSEKTALVLADENLLTAVLYSIPENVSDINITMGYPLVNTAVYTLFDAVFRMYINALKFGTEGNMRFYLRDIKEVLSNPYCRILILENEKSESEILQILNTSNRVLFSSSDILELIGKSETNILFDIKEEPVRKIPGMFITLIESIRSAAESKNNQAKDIEMDYLFHFAGVVNRLKNLLDETGFVKELKTLHTLFRNIVSSTSLPFVGEPLKGLQLMGMLETRNLDFENIILLSANENILPSGKHHNTFIPFDIRNSFGLSTYRQKEAIFAYHFYRLLQRAKNIHILYNSQADKLGGGEKSRFISQLLEELPKYNDKIVISQQILINNIKLSNHLNEISIEKTPEMLDILKTIAEKGFSPTALNSYISCPLKFYFSYIEGLEETEEAAETIDASTLGTVIHHVLKELYKNFINAAITFEDINKMLAQSPKKCEESFRLHYPDGDIRYGKNLLIAKVAIRLISNFLKEEARFVKSIEENHQQIIIRYLEEQFKAPLPEITVNNEVIRPLIKGSIDRIDECGRNLRIVDYKTGNVKSSELKIANWEQLISEPLLSKSMQLMCYAYALNPVNNSDLTAGIISLRRPSERFMPINVTENSNNIIDHAVLKSFEEVLVNLVSEIFDRSILFSQTKDTETCNNCAFSSICNR